MKEQATEAMREAEEEIKKLLKLQKQIILMNNINAQNKEIAMTLDDFEENEKKHEENRYLFGFEESYGYLSGTYVRDKDAVVASMLVCEMAAYYKKQGKSLAEVIDGLYEEFGYYLNQTYSFEFDGAAGMQKMSDIMTAVRDNTPKNIAGYDVVKVSDYLLRKETDVATGSVTDIDLPKSNVIALHLADDNAVIIRPSGTEPKIKLYITSVGKDKDNAAGICEKLVVASKEILGVE